MGGLATPLAGGGKVGGRRPRHERRPAVRRQVEQLTMRPTVGAVVRREDGRIADDADATLGNVLLERYPLPEEEVLHEDVPADLALQPPALPGQGGRLPRGDLGLPLRPRRAVVGVFEGHEEREVVQPRLLRGGEALNGGAPVRRGVLLEERERLLQQPLLVVDDRSVVDPAGGGRGSMVERRGREPAILNPHLGADQQWIAGEGGGGLGG